MRANCSQPSILDFPRLTLPEGQLGTVVIPVLIAIYLYLLLTAICENYFIPSINIICSKLELEEDTTGPTLLAAASSSPELFINIIGTFITEGDIGVGSIVGSALFNILAVPALCGLFTCRVIQLDPWPMLRDALIYCVAVAVLVVTLLDGKVEWYEALTFILLYFVYITVIYWNKLLKTFISLILIKTQNDETKQLITLGLGGKDEFLKCLQDQPSGNDIKENENLKLEGITESKLYYMMTIPITVALSYTIPDCRLKHRRQLYVMSFILCIVWIAFTTYLIVWMVTIAGYELNIPDSVMGLTFIAIGLSLPEAVVSVIIARQGNATTAISNSLGSNTFDILLCLGIPWFLKTTYFSTTSESFIHINSKGIGYSASFLFQVVFILIVVSSLNKFQLDKKIGTFFLITYIVFVTMSVILETNIIFLKQLPMCPLSNP